MPAPARALTQRQRNQFRDQGYVVYPDILSAAELAEVKERVADILYGRVPRPEALAGHAILQREPALVAAGVPAEDPMNDLRKLNYPAYFDPVFERIVRSPRILDVVEDLIGPDIFLQADQMFMKPPFHGSAAGWHQDSASWPGLLPADQVTVWIALDEATSENGCLRYIRGSHKLGLVLKEFVPQIIEQSVPRDEVVVPVPARGAVIHHTLTFHSSGRNETAMRRRGYAIHYMASATRDLRPPDHKRPGHLVMRGRQYPGHVYEHVNP